MSRKIEISFQTNAYNRTFLYINNEPTYTSWIGEPPKIEIREGRLFVDGKETILPKAIRGMVDNRHRSWRFRG
jgi:hypothetical protein